MNRFIAWLSNKKLEQGCPKTNLPEELLELEPVFLREIKNLDHSIDELFHVEQRLFLHLGEDHPLLLDITCLNDRILALQGQLYKVRQRLYL